MKDMRQPVNPRSLIGLVVRRKWLIITIALCFWGIDRLSIRASQSSISSPKTIAAERFLVVDSNGNERGRLAAEADGKVALVLWSREKSASASFQIDGSDMPRFVLENSKGNVVVDVGILRDDTPVILLKDRDGNRRMVFVVKADGTTSIQMFDKNEKPMSTLTLDKDGASELLLAYKSGKLGTRLTVDETDGGVFELKDNDGQTRFFSHVDAKGNAEFGTVDATGNIAWSSNRP